jgi:cytochrome c oxidase cbb3-type subunit III
MMGNLPVNSESVVEVRHMRHIALLVLVILIVAAVFVSGGRMEARLLRADPNSIPANAALMDFAVRRGKALFESHCVNCHGLGGRGDSTRGIPDLTDNDWLYGTGLVTDIEPIIEFGIRSRHPRAWNLAIMPAFARAQPNPRDIKMPPLSPAQIRDVVEFLLLEQGREADAAAAARGAQVYSGQGGCYDCHAADLKGDATIGAPNLTDRITLYGDGSRHSLFMSIAYGRQGMCPAWVKQIHPAGVRELALYVYSLSHLSWTGHVNE